MGLLNRSKKKNASEKDEMDGIGGLIDADTSFEKNILSESDSVEEESVLAIGDLETKTRESKVNDEFDLSKGDNQDEGNEGGKALSDLDIFTSEELEGDKENRLADKLSHVDINDLVRECREVVSQFEELVR